MKEEALTIEPFSEYSRYVYTKWIPNGHDCWGVSESYPEYSISVGTGKEREDIRVHTGMSIIRRGDEVLGACYHWNEESEVFRIRKMLGDRLQLKLDL